MTSTHSASLSIYTQSSYTFHADASHSTYLHYGQHVYALYRGEWVLSIIASDVYRKELNGHTLPISAWDVLIPSPSPTQHPIRIAVSPAFGNIRALEQHAYFGLRDGVVASSGWEMELQGHELRRLLSGEKERRRRGA